MSTTFPRQLRSRTVADRLDVSVKTLENWRQSGKGPPYRKLGTDRRSPVVYPEDLLQEWAESFPEVLNTGQAAGAA